MSETGENKLIAWLRNQIFIERPAGRIVRFELCHLPAGSRTGHEVSVIEPLGERPSEEWFEAQASLLLSQAESYAQGINSASGVQSFVVKAFREKEPTKCHGSFAHKVRVEIDDDDSGFEGSEPATKQGLLSQLMRHNEAMMRTNVAGQAAILATMHRTIQKLAEQNEALQDKRFEQIEVIEKVLTFEHERKLETLKSEQRAKLTDKLADDVKLLLPVVANRIAGRVVMDVPDSKGEGLNRLMASLTPEQKDALADSLKPFFEKLDQAQAIAFGELLRSN